MDALIADWMLALVRTTLCTVLAVCIARILLAKVRVFSSGVHQWTWLLVILQGWMFLPWTIEFAVPTVATAHKTIQVSATPQEAPIQISVDEHVRESIPPPVDRMRLWYITLTLGLCWIAGPIFIAFRATRNWLTLYRQLPLGSSPRKEDWQVEWHQTLRQTNLRQKVDLRITDRLGPLLCYLPFSYLILVPRALWTTLRSEQRQSILLHELAHLARGDLWKSLAMRFLALPQWFNPLAWYAVRRFDEAAEWACDDWTTQHSGACGSDFARTLLQVAGHDSTSLPTALAANGGIMSQRIKRLIQPNFKEDSKMQKFAIPVVLILLTMCQLSRVKFVEAEEPAINSPDQLQLPDPWHPYRIGPRDQISIVAKQVDLNVIVDRDGRVDLGKHGKVVLNGLTVGEAQDRISNTLSPKDSKSQVSVNVVEPLSKFTIVVVEDTAGRKITEVYSCRPDSRISDVMQGGMARRIDMATARILVHHRAVDPIRDIQVLEIDPLAVINAPDGPTNCQILPNDLIEILRIPSEKTSTDIDWDQPYVIDPPDIVQISGKGIDIQAIVDPAGMVDLGDQKKVSIGGLTVELAQAEIMKTLPALRPVSVKVSQRNSKPYYVILKGGIQGDNVHRFVCLRSTKLRDALKDAIALDTVEICDNKALVIRPSANGEKKGTEKEFQVDWENLEENKVAENFQILPGDRVIINVRRSQTVQKSAALMPVPPTAATKQRKKQISLSFQFIEDREGRLNEMFSFKNRTCRYEDTPQFLKTIQALSQSNAVEILADPKIRILNGGIGVVEIGEQATDGVLQASTWPTASPENIRLEVSAQTFSGDNIQLGIKPRFTRGDIVSGIDASASVTDRDTTVLVKLENSMEADKPTNDIYVAVRPEIVSAADQEE